MPRDHTPSPDGQRYHSNRIRHRDGDTLRIVPIDESNVGEIAHFRKALACEMMTVDHHWRQPGGYDTATVDKFLRDCGGSEEARHGLAEYWQFRTRRGDMQMYACYAGKRLIGFGALTDAAKISPRSAHLGIQLTHLYVLPGYERLGVASALLDHLEKRARSLGVEELSLDAAANAEGFYKKHGYVDAPEDDVRRDTPDGALLRRLMVKDLTRERAPEAACFSPEELRAQFEGHERPDKPPYMGR